MLSFVVVPFRNNYDRDSVQDPEILRIAAVTRLQPTLPNEWGCGVAARVTVSTRSGASFFGEVVEARGFPGRPLTRQALEEKFWINVEHGGGISPGCAEQTLAMRHELEAVDDVRKLVGYLVARS